MNSQQIEWARSHDWFLTSHTNENGELIVVCIDAYTLNGECHEEQVEFTEFHTMREWAGY